jgi:hypothetical protein
VSQTLQIAVFWIAVVVAVRLAVCFPESSFARMLYSHHGPVRGRGEPEPDFLLRRARFHGGWFAQAAFAFAAGWLALAWDASLGESLYFLVLWAAVIPALGCAALAATLGDALRARRLRNAVRQPRPPPSRDLSRGANR